MTVVLIRATLSLSIYSINVILLNFMNEFGSLYASHITIIVNEYVRINNILSFNLVIHGDIYMCVC